MKILNGRISIEALLKARRQLKQAIATAKTELEITGSIKCFEYSYELSWKTMKKILEAMGLTDINSPRLVFAAAAKNGIIIDLDAWNSFIEKRNLTSHTYDETLAHEVFDFLPHFLKHLDALIMKIKEM